MDYYHPDYSEKKDLVTKSTNHYIMISEQLGCKVIPMQAYINSFAFGMGSYGRKDLALELFNYNISLYPDTPIVLNNLRFYYMNNGNSKKAIEQFDKSLRIKDDEVISNI